MKHFKMYIAPSLIALGVALLAVCFFFHCRTNIIPSFAVLLVLVGIVVDVVLKKRHSEPSSSEDDTE